MFRPVAIRTTVVALPRWWPAGAYLALLIVLPVMWFPGRVPLLTLAALPVLVWLPLASWRLTPRPLARTGFEWPLILVLLATCLAAAPVSDWDLGLPKLLGMALGVVSLVVMLHTVRTRRAVERAIAAIAVGLVLLSAFALVAVEWTIGKAPLLDPLYVRLPHLVSGVAAYTPSGAIHPNEVAGVLVLLTPVVLAYGVGLLLARGWLAASPLLAAGAVALGVLVLTQSRSALVAAAIVVVALGGRIAFELRAARRTPGWLRTSVLPAFVVLSGVLSVVIWRILSEWLRGEARADPGSVLNTFSGRLELWQRALYMLQDVPLTGIGIGQFDPVLQAFYPPFLAPPDRPVPHAHNVFLSFAVELGIPGALAVGAVGWLALRGCWRAMRTADFTLIWAGLGLALGILGFLIYGLADAIAPGARAGLVLWVMLGLGGVVGRLATAAQPTRSGQAARAAAPLGESP